MPEMVENNEKSNGTDTKEVDGLRKNDKDECGVVTNDGSGDGVDSKDCDGE